jgi:hypothetical protein
MNAKAFKRLIKEAVIDAIHEELPYILEEHMAKQEKKALREGRTIGFTSADVMTGNITDVKSSLHSKMGAMFGYEAPQAQSSLKVDPAAENPFMAFIEDAGANMTAQDLSGLRNLG